METEIWAVGLVVLASIIGSFGLVFIKKGSKRFKLRLKALLVNHEFIIGIFFYVVATVLFIPALKGGELSVLYPLVSLTYVWVSLLSIRMLNEKMNKFKWLGVLFVIIGVSLIGFGS